MNRDAACAIYRNMLAQSAKLHKGDVWNALNQAQGRLRDLLNLGTKTTPLIAFVGLTNAGKSTLLSALFSAKVAPTSNRPWSSVPVEYRYGPEFEVSAEFSDSVESKGGRFDDADGMLDFIAKYATAGGVRSSFLSARMPSPILADGLVIADTPGFGAAAASGGEDHGAKLVNYLPQADYVFWVIKSLQGITRVEGDFYVKFLAGRCHDVVVNCFDDLTETDKTEFVRVNEKALGVRMSWHFVNAKSALSGCVRGDAELVDGSGLHDLESRMRELTVTPERRGRVEADLVKLFSDIGRFRRRQKCPRFFDEIERMRLECALGDPETDDPVARAMRESIS